MLHSCPSSCLVRGPWWWVHRLMTCNVSECRQQIWLARTNFHPLSCPGATQCHSLECCCQASQRCDTFSWDTVTCTQIHERLCNNNTKWLSLQSRISSVILLLLLFNWTTLASSANQSLQTAVQELLWVTCPSWYPTDSVTAVKLTVITGRIGLILCHRATHHIHKLQWDTNLHTSIYYNI